MSQYETEFEEGRTAVAQRQSTLLAQLDKDLQGAVGAVVLVARIEPTKASVSYYMVGFVPERVFDDLQHAARLIGEELQNAEGE